MIDTSCHCMGHVKPTEGKRAAFYSGHFIPTGWSLSYSSLGENMRLYLVGFCRDCHERLEERLPLNSGLSGDALFADIYDTMWSCHPYDTTLEGGTYYGKCQERSAFYRSRDAWDNMERGRRFLSLFHDQDRTQAMRWLEKHDPPQSRTEVYRDTGGSLFLEVVRLAKEHGDFDAAEKILDYVLPNASESDSRGSTYLTDYQFDFVPIVNFGGSEGIYVDCSLQGKFDESGRHTLHVGTLKTLETSLDACKTMGELCGTLMYFADEYVNRQIHRYTPDKELAAQARYQAEREAQKANADASALKEGQ